MQIQINEQPLELASTTTLAELLSSQKINTSAIAVAVNGEVIHREQWSHKRLQNNDVVTLVQAVAGG